MSPLLSIKQLITQALRELTDLSESDLTFSSFQLEFPRDSSHGDLTSNVAMIFSKKIGKDSFLLAQDIAKKLLHHLDIFDVNVAKPGFINIIMHNHFWHKILQDILTNQEYGRSTMGGNEKVNLEYVSANPTGPMHVGHCRGAVVGDVLSNIFSFCGYDVTREYYVNDAGAQIDTLGHSVLLRYQEALGQEIKDIPTGLYPGEYLKPLGALLKVEYGDSLLKKPQEEALNIIKKRSIAFVMEMIHQDLEMLGVFHDVFFYEQSLHENGSIVKTINFLNDLGYIYTGILPPPKGGGGKNTEQECDQGEHLLFRSSLMGDEVDRVLIKSDGSFTYFAADIAYLHDKIFRGFTKVIFILGADHAGYVKRMQALGQALTQQKLSLDVLLCNLVQLSRDGKPVRMSKRAGEFVTLRDVIDEVGSDAIRFMMLYRKSDAPLDFDFVKVMEQSKENPVFYVQYASARCHSVFRQAQHEIPDFHIDREDLKKNIFLLDNKAEMALIRKLAEYPILVLSIAQTYDVHKLAFYLYDLATLFHAHWNRGVLDSSLRFVNLNQLEQTKARLGLVQAVLDVLSSGLRLMGIKACVEMR